MESRICRLFLKAVTATGILICSVNATRALAEEAQQKTEAEEKKQNAENRKINCENARKNLEQLNYGGHRLTQLPDGSYQRMDEKQKQAQVEKNKKAISEYCD